MKNELKANRDTRSTWCYFRFSITTRRLSDRTPVQHRLVQDRYTKRRHCLAGPAADQVNIMLWM